MFISHRVNYLDSTIAANIFSAADGIEFDIRDSGGRILVQHDPFKDGQDFKNFLTFCVPNKIYIVNVKSEGIEALAIDLMEAHGLTNFFLLDCSIPMMVRLGRSGEKRLAVRYSEYESLETVRTMAPFVSWVWVDTFTSLVLTTAIANEIHSLGLRICLVSPELQGQQEKVEMYRDRLKAEGVYVDAVCSKQYNREHWM
jgi:hypothetical protein